MKNPRCIFKDEFDFCHNPIELGDDCEGKCKSFESGKYKTINIEENYN